MLGCRDSFGARQTVTPPLSPVESTQHYPDCAKTPELMALIGKAKWDPAFVNYCLKASQTDFTDPTGLAVRVGNSVTEQGFVAQASCMTCHARAGVDVTGKMIAFAGFDPISINIPAAQIFNNAGNAPVGPVNPAWYWQPDGPPYTPILANDPNLTRIALPADFVWSIPFCAIDDTANPKETTSRFCGGK